MRAAVTALEIQLEILEHNEPISREAGDTVCAGRQYQDAAEIRQAIAVLKAAVAGPAYPEPE